MRWLTWRCPACPPVTIGSKRGSPCTCSPSRGHARAEIRPEEVWREFAVGMPKGTPSPGRGPTPALDDTPDWARTYWGGATFCLVADLAMRERTGNRLGLPDALRGVLGSGEKRRPDVEYPIACSTPRTRRWGQSCFDPCATRCVATAWSIDLGRLFRELGVTLQDGSVTLVDDAPLASVRRAIHRPACRRHARPRRMLMGTLRAHGTTLRLERDSVPAMIGRLTGRVVAQEAEGAVVVDVGGVGYELAVPLGTIGRAHLDDAGRVTLWIHTHVREDALALFGFADDFERGAFRALLGVSNVGPKIAVAVLGALPAAELARAIARQDLGAFKGVSGVGKKIAERLLLELRDKLPAMSLPASAASPGGARGPSDGDDRLRGALTGMGFRPAEADRAIATLGPRMEGAPLEDLLREALALLAK